MKTISVITSAIACALAFTSAFAQEKTPGFNQKIPEKIMTPDTVNTRIGALNFVDGVPTLETMQKVYDNLDFLCGIEVFLNLVRATSLEGMRLGNVNRAISFGDNTGEPFDGAKNYKVNTPANAPAKDFWSMVVYDPQTRSELQTSQPYLGLNSTKSKFKRNADGSVDLYFGPKAPKGMESNWLATVPSKGWFAILRLYTRSIRGSTRPGVRARSSW